MKKVINSQKGVGLIEVLVAVLLLSTCLLVMAALQTRSLQFNQSAYLRSQANILAYDIIDRMRLNRNDLDNYSIAVTDAPPAGSTLAAVDVREWRANLSATIPDGTGSIDCNLAGVCTIGIQWVESISGESISGTTTTFSFSTQI